MSCCEIGAGQLENLFVYWPPAGTQLYILKPSISTKPYILKPSISKNCIFGVAAKRGVAEKTSYQRTLYPQNIISKKLYITQHYITKALSQNKLYRMVAISKIYEGILRPTNHHKWVHSML